MGGSKKQTIGYWYYMSLHIGLWRGPCDLISEIRVGDRTAWTGVVEGSVSTTINAPDLFGGEKKEGGIDGTLDIMMGDAAQLPNTRTGSEASGVVVKGLPGIEYKEFSIMPGIHGSLIPAFRGICTLLFDGKLSALNPYPKKWAVRGARWSRGWDNDECWYPAAAHIPLAGGSINAMNPAHIIYECQTNTAWGRGRPAERLNVASYAAAADTLLAENFGLCLKWTRKDSVDNFEQLVIDHIGGMQFISRRTGLLTLKLIRDDYIAADLPLFDYDTGLLSIDENSIVVSDTIINQVIVNWFDPIKKEERSTHVENLGSIQQAGAIYSQTVDYLGLSTNDLAGRVAQRDLRAAAGSRRFKLKFDRRAYLIEPGDVFRISADDHGISEIVLRAVRVDFADGNDGTITITAIQDVFSLPAAAPVGEQQSTHIAQTLTPVPVAEQQLIEVPYRDLCLQLSAADRAILTDDSGYVAALGIRPSSASLNYILTTRTTLTAHTERAQGDWVPSGTLSDDLTRQPTAANITLTGVRNLDLVDVGSIALIDSELVRVDAVDVGLSSVTLSRAVADTIPATHLAGARIWFYEGFAAVDLSEYTDTDTVYAKLLTQAGGGVLDAALATEATATIDSRQARPYPPARVQLNGEYFPAAIDGELTISWAHRDRTLQLDVLVPWTDSDIGPEPGTTYTLELYSETGSLVKTVTGITGNSYTWATELADSSLTRFNSAVRVRLWSVRDGLDSHQVFDYTCDRAGYGLHYGKYYGGGI